jgi:hypothetical protein
MKAEAFGYSGDCHEPGVADPSGLPFPRRQESRMNEVKKGYPPTTAGMTEVRGYDRREETSTRHALPG